jgi:hypothetical protein
MKLILKRSHPDWPRNANRSSNNAVAKTLVTINPANPNFLMKNRRAGLRSPSPLTSPLLVAIASTQTSAIAVRSNVASMAECKRESHIKLTAIRVSLQEEVGSLVKRMANLAFSSGA